jgi:hypothetical protein
MDRIINFLTERLTAYEGGAESIHIGYDDATFNYVITQGSKILGCSRSLSRAFTLAISGQVYD